MPYFATPFTINNGDIASASYLTAMVQVSSYASGSMVILGNSGSASSALQEYTLGNGLGFTSSTFGFPGTATFSSVSITTPAAVISGGTGASSVAAANQILTTATITITESTGSGTIDWSKGNSFYLLLNANCTLSFSNQVDGQVISVAILNTASNYTVTWPSMKWAGGVAPTMTIGAHYDVYSIYYNNAAGQFFGAFVQNF